MKFTGKQFTLLGGARVVVAKSEPRRIAGGDVVTVAWVSDDTSQRFADGTVHPAHRAGFSWDEPTCNLRPVKMTKTDAMKKLVETRELSTDLLEPLGIRFESFLKLAQLPKAEADAVIEKIVKQYETELAKTAELT